MFKDFLKNSAEKFGLNLTENQLDKFQKFYELVVKKNSEVNLTSITTPEDFAVKHIIDSLSAWDDEKFSGAKKFIDVGTGGGFPGIPLKIFRPEIEICLADSLNKRINFLKDAVKILELEKVECVHGRAEDLAKMPEYRENFDVAISRAVARINVLSEYCLPFVKIGGIFVAMKGRNFEEEVSESEKAVKILGGGEVGIVKKILPEDEGERAIIYVKKNSRTPEKYPRKAGMPLKNPL